MSGSFGTVYSAAAGGNWNSAATWKLDLAGTQAGFVPTGNVNTIITGNTVTANVTARAKDLTIRPAGKLTVNSSIGLTTTGNFLITSDATGTGSFLNNGTLTVAGSTNVQRWVTGNWSGGWPTASTIWHYISSPVSGATIATFTGSLLNHWSEALETWVVDTLPLTLPLTPGTGFSLAKAAPDGVVTFNGGTLNNNASYAPTISWTAGSWAGWNLVGNPYPCAVSWNSLIKANLLATVYTWNAATSNYISYNGSIGALTNGIIPAEQAFFVQALSSASPSLTIPAISRQHNNSVLYKSTVDNLLTLNLKGNSAAEDFAFVNFRNDATTAFDNDFDAYKLFGTADAPQIYSITTTDNLTINTLPDVTSEPIVKLGVQVGLNDTYTLTASDLSSFAFGTMVLLEDTKTGEIRNLMTNPVYSFTAAPGDPVNRLNLHFTTVGTPENQAAKGIEIYSAGKTVYVNLPATMKGTVHVYNMLGSELAQHALEGKMTRFAIDAATGFYLVRVEGETASSTGKVFIR